MVPLKPLALLALGSFGAFVAAATYKGHTIHNNLLMAATGTHNRMCTGTPPTNKWVIIPISPGDPTDFCWRFAGLWRNGEALNNPEPVLIAGTCVTGPSDCTLQGSATTMSTFAPQGPKGLAWTLFEI